MFGCCYCSAARDVDINVSLVWSGYVMQCGVLVATAFYVHNKPFFCPVNCTVYWLQQL